MRERYSDYTRIDYEKCLTWKDLHISFLFEAQEIPERVRLAQKNQTQIPYISCIFSSIWNTRKGELEKLINDAIYNVWLSNSLIQYSSYTYFTSKIHFMHKEPPSPIILEIFLPQFKPQFLAKPPKGLSDSDLIIFYQALHFHIQQKIVQCKD